MNKTISKQNNDNDMISATIRLFKGVLSPDHKASDQMFAKVNKEATKHGLIAPKEVCSEELYQWLTKKKEVNRNTTFYKNWNDIISKNRFELFLDQITHYLSTYGTDFEGKTYIPNKEPKKIPFDFYTVIKTLSREEIIKSCEKLISANVALDKDAIKDILVIFNCLSHKVNEKNVKNKEILMHLHDITNTVPDSPVEMVRFLLFKSIGKTLLIKDKATIAEIKLERKNITKLMHKCGLKKLASVFFRFKPIFLAFKTNPNNASCINKIRKLAKKYHKPMEIGYFESLLSTKRDLEEVKQKLKTLNNFKKVILLNTILNRLHNSSKFSPYLIRNGRLYVKEKTNAQMDEKYLKGLFDVIYDSLVKEMSKKACKVVLPENIKLAMPTSSKKFIGEIPLGSTINLEDTDNIIGIHWRNEDGAHDIDLSSIDISGRKIGWNSDYYHSNNSVIYSGDMTNADPEATELLYTSGNFQPSVINVSLYTGHNGSKFEFFIAQEKIAKLKSNYMVNPNNIVFKTTCVFENDKEKVLGIATKRKFVFQNIKINTSNVSSSSEWKKGYIDYIVNSIDYTIMLENVLKDAGFEFIDAKDSDETKKEILDLSNFSKEQILNIVCDKC